MKYLVVTRDNIINLVSVSLLKSKVLNFLKKVINYEEEMSKAIDFKMLFYWLHRRFADILKIMLQNIVLK